MPLKDDMKPIHLLDPRRTAAEIAERIRRRALAMLSIEDPTTLAPQQRVVAENVERALRYAQTGEGNVDGPLREWFKSAVFDSTFAEMDELDLAGDSVEGAMLLAIDGRDKLARLVDLWPKEMAAVSRLTPRRIRQLAQEGELRQLNDGTISAHTALRFLVKREVPGFSLPPTDTKKPQERKKNR